MACAHTDEASAPLPQASLRAVGSRVRSNGPHSRALGMNCPRSRSRCENGSCAGRPSPRARSDASQDYADPTGCRAACRLGGVVGRVRSAIGGTGFDARASAGPCPRSCSSAGARASAGPLGERRAVPRCNASCSTSDFDAAGCGAEGAGAREAFGRRQAAGRRRKAANRASETVTARREADGRDGTAFRRSRAAAGSDGAAI